MLIADSKTGSLMAEQSMSMAYVVLETIDGSNECMD
jgi:hypothetical protein